MAAINLVGSAQNGGRKINARNIFLRVSQQDAPPRNGSADFHDKFIKRIVDHANRNCL
jgi:hypothetical protein